MSVLTKLVLVALFGAVAGGMAAMSLGLWCFLPGAVVGWFIADLDSAFRRTV